MTTNWQIPNAPTALGWGTLGFSEAAVSTEMAVKESFQRLLQPESNPSVLKRVLSDLMELFDETSHEGWDGYSAAPLQEGSFANAYSFLESLPPYLETPSLSAEPDGYVTVEWYCTPKRTLSVSIGPSGKLHYAALIGPNEAYGTELFIGRVPNFILHHLDRIYSA